MAAFSAITYGVANAAYGIKWAMGNIVMQSAELVNLHCSKVGFRGNTSTLAKDAPSGYLATLQYASKFAVTLSFGIRLVKVYSKPHSVTIYRKLHSYIVSMVCICPLT